MKSSILLLNLGNRNLKWYREFVPATNQDRVATYKEHNRDNAFVEVTRNLLEDFEEAEVTPCILPDIIDFKREELAEVVMFYSEQVPLHDQDTVYAAQILQRILPDYYPEITFTLARIESDDITDTNALMVYFRRYLHARKQQQPDAKVIICDAGGTAQAKMALKICAEYVLDEKQLEVYYVRQPQHGEEQGQVEKVQAVEYRKILDLEAVHALLQQSNYSGAATIYRQTIEDPEKDLTCRLLHFADLRFNLLTEEGRKYVAANFSPEEKEQFPFLQNYAKEQSSGNLDGFRAILEGNQFFRITEALERASRLYDLGQYAFAAVEFFRLQEIYVKFVIKKNASLDVMESEHRRIISEAFNESQGRDKFAKDRFVSACLWYAREKVNNLQHQLVIAAFVNTNSYFLNGKGKGLDVLRNGVVHLGKGVSKALLLKYCPNFEYQKVQWSRALGLRNEYETMNRLIAGLL